MAITSTIISKHKAIFLIISLAFLLRFINIDGNPKAMYGDSLTLVYDAYSILKTGHDQTGQFLPVFFSMGGGRPAGYIYPTIPFVFIFGPTAVAARAVSILSGVGVVALIYFILFEIFPRKWKVALIGALISAITPWELSMSRGAFESHFALFLALFGFYIFLKAQRKYVLYLLSGLSFALSMQTYSTYVLTIPIFTAFLLMLSKPKLKRAIFPMVIMVVLSLTLSLAIAKDRGSKDRFTNLFIFNQPEIQNKVSATVTTERSFSSLKPELALRLHNKYLEYVGLLIGNYAKNFGVRFLFLSGDENPRHNPASMGGLLWFMLPLIILGSLYLYNHHKQILLLLFGWILIGPLASSLVGEPHALRGSFMLPPLIILAALGIEGLYTVKDPNKLKTLKFLLLILFLTQLPFFINRFYFLSPNLNARFWSYSARLASEKALTERGKFDYIILSTSIDDMEFAYPVYARIDPAKVIDQNNHKTYFGEFAFKKFDNVYLGTIPGSRAKEILNSLNGSVMYLGPIEDRGMVENETIQRDKDESPLFVVSTRKK